MRVLLEVDVPGVAGVNHCGVVDENVEAAKARPGLVKRRLPLVARADVEMERDGIDACCRRDGFGCFVVDVGDDDLMTERSGELGRRGADPAGGAGDEIDL
jgi:hypothetical protein